MHWLFDSHFSLCSEYQLSSSGGWLRLWLGYDIIKPFSDKTSGKFAIQVQSVWGCRKWQNTELSLSLKSPASEDRPRRSRSFNLNIDSVELISSNSSSSLRRRNAHSNDDIENDIPKHLTLSLKASMLRGPINYAACFISKWFKMHCVSFKNNIAKKVQLLKYFFLSDIIIQKIC